MSKSIGFRLRNEALNENRTPTVSIDEKYGIYRNLEEACLKIPITQRSIGLTVCIETAQGIVKEYWWQETIADEGLVKKYDEEEIISIFNEIDTINERLDLIKNIQFRVVEELPLIGEENVRYLVSNGIASGDNKYDEYFWLVEEQRYEKYGGINASGSIIVNNNYNFDSDHFIQSTLNYITTVSLKNPLGSLISSSGNLIRFANTTTGIIESVTGAEFYIGKSSKIQGIVFNDDHVNIKGNIKINDYYPVLSGSNGLSVSGNVMSINTSGSINFGGHINLSGSVELHNTSIYGSTVGSITHSGNVNILCGANHINITSGDLSIYGSSNIYINAYNGGSLLLFGSIVNMTGSNINILGSNINISGSVGIIGDIRHTGQLQTNEIIVEDDNNDPLFNVNPTYGVSIDNKPLSVLSGATIKGDINLSGSNINLIGSNINLSGNINLTGDINAGDITGSLAAIKKDYRNINIKSNISGSINLEGNNITIGKMLTTGNGGNIYLGFNGSGAGNVYIMDRNLTWKFSNGSFVLQQ